MKGERNSFNMICFDSPMIIVGFIKNYAKNLLNLIIFLQNALIDVKFAIKTCVK